MREFWPRPDWHAKGLPTREELRAQLAWAEELRAANRRLAARISARPVLLDRVLQSDRSDREETS